MSELTSGALTNTFRERYDTDAPTGIGVEAIASVVAPHAGVIQSLQIELRLVHQFPVLGEYQVDLASPAGEFFTLVEQGSLNGAEADLVFGLESELPDGRTLHDSLRQDGNIPLEGIWSIRVLDLIENGNEGQGTIEQVVLAVEYDASGRVRASGTVETATSRFATLEDLERILPEHFCYVKTEQHPCAGGFVRQTVVRSTIPGSGGDYWSDVNPGGEPSPSVRIYTTGRRTGNWSETYCCR